MTMDLMERRQNRRADLKAQVVIRPIEDTADAASVIGRVKNVSLSGVYAYVPASFSIAPGSAIAISVSIPQESTRQFPFVRLLGKGWLVRIDRPEEKSHKRRAAKETGKEAASAGLNLQDILGTGEEVGVAIAFTRDVTALGAVGASYQ